MKALTLAHDKLLRGRKLVVTFAHQAPLDQYGNGVMSGSKHKKSMMETGRPTTLSMLKTGLATRHEGQVVRYASGTPHLHRCQENAGQDCYDGSQATADGEHESQASGYRGRNRRVR
jgi:hypothetical protein